MWKEAQFSLLPIAVLSLTFSFAVIYDPAGDPPGEPTRPLALVPVTLYGFSLFIQCHDSLEYDSGEAVGDVSPARWRGAPVGLSVAFVAWLLVEGFGVASFAP